MFGDIAHGLVLLAFGIYLVFFDERVKRGSLKILSPLRYMITMMGFFAFYCGWIYNDFIGMSLNIFGSCYHPGPKPDGGDSNLIAKAYFPDKDCIYPIGLDPIWGRSTNELVYINALKMKISVIIAVIHMTLGIILKAYNALFFKRTIEFIF
jgi:V-type H+-transporting ATPase subunit a